MVALHWGVFLAYQALWAAPWLRDVALLGRSDVAETMLIFNIGMLAGVLSIGVFAELFTATRYPTSGALNNWHYPINHSAGNVRAGMD